MSNASCLWQADLALGPFLNPFIYPSCCPRAQSPDIVLLLLQVHCIQIQSSENVNGKLAMQCNSQDKCSLTYSACRRQSWQIRCPRSDIYSSPTRLENCILFLSVQGVIRIRPCGVAYWLITLFQLPAAAAFTGYIIYAKRKKHVVHTQEDGKVA